uniref:hypothetical protein n=1 Tax=Gelidibacter sp. TaxID=2018083 RepID=UPI00404B88B0
MNFTEKQKFTQWWVWMIVLAMSSIAVAGFVQQIILKKPFGDNPMSDTGVIVFVVFITLFFCLFVFMKLNTAIDRSGIKMHFVPFVKKDVKWEDVKSVRVVNYGFVGGWGIRFGSSYGTIYNVKGKMGLAIELKNDKKFLIGTQKPQEIQNVIDRYFNKTSEETQ